MDPTVEWKVPDGAPQGLRYIPALISSEEEQHLLDHLCRESVWSPPVMRGQAAKRLVLHFGFSYAYNSRSLEPAAPLPPYLLDLRRCAAKAAGQPAENFHQVIVSQYPAGSAIGWHIDAPVFGDPILGVSLGAPCSMGFRGPGSARFKVLLEPRSLLILSGEARKLWQHRTSPVRGLRYSITLRPVLASATAL